MVQEEIPLMDYVIVTTKARYEYANECISSVVRQSNVKTVVLMLKESLNTGHFFAKIFGVKRTKTDYVVLVDDDVLLKENWIEEMWPHVKDNVSVGGFVYLNDEHLKRAKDLGFPRFGGMEEVRLQNSIVKREYLENFNYHEGYYGIDAGAYFWKFLKEKGLGHWLVPVYSPHVPSHIATPLREGIRGGARRRFMGLIGIKDIFKKVVFTVFGGIKLFVINRSPWYLRHALLQAGGGLYGFFKWRECLEEYDYG